MPSVWWTELPSPDRALQDLLGRSAASGMVVRTDHAPDPAVPGVLVLHDEDAAAELLVRECSRCEGGFVIVCYDRAGTLSPSFKWKLVHAGAADLLDLGSCVDPWERIRARMERRNEIEEVMDSDLVRRNLIGSARDWQNAIRRSIEAGLFIDSPVLITGETGTGKELLARLIHTTDSRRQEGALVVLDCGALVPDLSGSEFFGHTRGSYTGALDSRTGAFAQADGGTLFLDEVGELPLDLQVQLLRVIQERTFKQVGGSSWQSTDFRLVCATHRNLGKEVEEGRFREDLLYRLSTWTIHAPPLRERAADIPVLVQYFLRETLGVEEPVSLDPDLLRHLMAQGYPGNVRELRHLTARIATRYRGPGPIALTDLPRSDRPAGSPPSTIELFEAAVTRALAADASLKAIGRAAEDAAIRLALEGTGGNLTHAAHRLGITPRALQMRRATNRNGNRNGNGNGNGGDPR